MFILVLKKAQVFSHINRYTLVMKAKWLCRWFKKKSSEFHNVPFYTSPSNTCLDIWLCYSGTEWSTRKNVVNVYCICPEADSGTCKVPNNFHMQRSSTCTAIFWDKWTLKLLTKYSYCVLVPRLLLQCLCKNPLYSAGGICLNRGMFISGETMCNAYNMNC